MAKGKDKRSRTLLIVLVCAIAAVGVLFMLYRYTDIFKGKGAYPLAYEEPIVKYSEEYDLDPYLVAAVINTESGFKPQAVSHAGAMGLMQIMPDTGDWIAGKLGEQSHDLLDPETNIRYGCWYLRFLFDRFGEDVSLVTAAYNAGHGRVSEWLGSEEYSDGDTLTDIPYQETENYVRKVKTAYEKYEKYYEIG